MDLILHNIPIKELPADLLTVVLEPAKFREVVFN